MICAPKCSQYACTFPVYEAFISQTKGYYIKHTLYYIHICLPKCMYRMYIYFSRYRPYTSPSGTCHWSVTESPLIITSLQLLIGLFMRTACVSNSNFIVIRFIYISQNQELDYFSDRYVHQLATHIITRTR